MVIKCEESDNYEEDTEMDEKIEKEEDIWIPLNPVTSSKQPYIVSAVPEPDFIENDVGIRRPINLNRDIDKGWAWVVLMSTFMAYFVMQGHAFTGNIYFVIYLQTFQQSRSYTALAGSTYTAAVTFIGPLTSYFVLKWGPRVMMITGGLFVSTSFLLIFTAQSMLEIIIYSTIRGAGVNFIICSCQSALSKYFTKRLYLATSIMYTASALGMTAVAYITDYVVDEFGWRGSLLIQTGIALQIVVFGSLIFRLPKESIPISLIEEDGLLNGHSKRKKKKPPKKKLQIKKYLTDVLFWLTGLSTTCLFIFMAIVFQFWKDILPNKEHFKVAIVAMAVGSTFGRITAGLISKAITPSIHNAIVTAIGGVAVMFFLIADKVWIVAVQSFVWGFCNGQHIVADRLQMAWVFGPKEVASVVGLTFGFAGVGSVTMLPLAGLITDVTGNYTATLSLCSAALFIASINSLIIFTIKKRRLKAEENRGKRVCFNVNNETEMQTIKSSQTKNEPEDVK